MSMKTDNNTENKSSKETGIFDKTKKTVSSSVKLIDKLAGVTGSIGNFLGALPILGKILVVSALAGGMTLLVKAFAVLHELAGDDILFCLGVRKVVPGANGRDKSVYLNDVTHLFICGLVFGMVFNVAAYMVVAASLDNQ